MTCIIGYEYKNHVYIGGDSAAVAGSELGCRSDEKVFKNELWLQISKQCGRALLFLEQNELKVRPYDFGTDALERMRVGLPQAMIDADFEYGLQPTKWQAIATQRGYPSTYEVSATDVQVVSVTTDASTGSSGVGSASRRNRRPTLAPPRSPRGS